MRLQGIRGFHFQELELQMELQGIISRQFIKTLAEVTPKGGTVRESYMCHQDTSVA